MIELQNLGKTIGRNEILRGIDLSVEEGETLAILGRSGGGKSVILKHIIGLMKPTFGEVLIEGQNIAAFSERELGPIRKMVAILFQSAALFDSMTVAQNLAFPLREAGERDEKIIAEKVAEMLEVVNLRDQQPKMPESLSGGMRKRVGLARAIITRPRCILYDEPTTGLDPIASDSINRLIRAMQGRYGITSIVVTHDLKTAAHVADRVAYLHGGRIHFEGAFADFERSTDPMIRDFIDGRSRDEYEAL